MKTGFIFTTLFLPVILTLFSCGPTTEEVAAKEKSKIDSIAKVTEDNIRLKIEREKEVADSLAEVKEMKAFLKQSISSANTELRLSKEKLSKVKEFSLLRSSYEKEQQITNQYKVIQAWEDEIRRLQEQLDEYN